MPDVAPNNENTLEAPALRLPLGNPLPCGAGFTHWRVYVPTLLGGVLTVRCPGAVVVGIQQPLGTQLAIGSFEVSAKVAFGPVWVIAIGLESAMIGANLVQTAWATRTSRFTNPDAAPLLPWNFYYWASDRESSFATAARETLRKYANAIGRLPDAAEAWEIKNHQRDGAGRWEGHCHLMAPASAYFVQPAGQTINGQSFSEDEMEFLAGEWFAAYGNEAYGWHIDEMDGLPFSSIKPTYPRKIDRRSNASFALGTRRSRTRRSRSTRRRSPTGSTAVESRCGFVGRGERTRRRSSRHCKHSSAPKAAH